MADDEGYAPLTHEILCQGLSNIEPAVGGGGFAFTHLDCSNKELTHLGNKVQDYKQLRHIVLSNNRISDVAALTALPHLLTLQISSNEVASLDCMQAAQLPWCQRIDFSSNKLKKLPRIKLERLKYASFAGNEISSLAGFGDHPHLEELDLQANQLTSLRGLGPMEGLRKLVVSGNQLVSLEGLDAPALMHLDVSKNQLASLEHVGGAPGCIELDLRENQLSAEDPRLPELRKLGAALPELRSLQLAGNPSDLRLEAVLCVPHVLSIDGEAITDEDREGALERERALLEAIKEADKVEATSEDGR